MIIIANDYYIFLGHICALGIFVVTLLWNALICKHQLFWKGTRCFSAENCKQDNFSSVFSDQA